jgi:cytidylate kinase
MYRGVAWAAVRAGIPPDNRTQVRKIFARTRLTFTDEKRPRSL